jgi:hypothetical protein
MKKSKIAVLIITCLVFANILLKFDYSNLSWNNNSVGYLKIITMFVFLFIIKMIAEKTSKYKNKKK